MSRFDDKLTLGADPEFGLVNEDGEAVYAENAYDDGGDAYDDRFGLDGSSEVLELRPAPAVRPRKLVENIRELLVDGYRNVGTCGDYVWKAGSMVGDYPIGGHIHFGTRDLERNGDIGDWWRVEKSIDYLDSYVAQVIALLEPRSEFYERQHSYGNLRNYREQDWGWEYRVLGSWLVSPRVAAGVLSLAKVAFCESLELQAEGNRGNLVPTDLRITNEEYRNDITRKGMFNRYPRLRESIQAMSDYSKYKKDIRFLFKLIDSGLTWFPPTLDMRSSWALDKRTIVKTKDSLKAKSLSRLWFPYTRQGRRRSPRRRNR